MKVIPLGGLDAIGKNMMVVECKNDSIIIDAGLMFPDDDHLGVDLLLPDYSYVLEHADRLRGIIITHGHEDHTGALPYLLKDLERTVPVFGTRMTLGLVEGKLNEFHVDKPELREINASGGIKLGCFDISFFAVNHSIPGSVGLFLRSPAGTMLHTGDFKLDQTPIDGVRTDFAALTRYGEEGVDLLCSDSTNADKREFTKSEAEVGKVLNDIIFKARRRVIVASFSSHIHRIQQICNAAIAADRKVVVTGRSMLQNTRIAKDLGYLSVPDGLIIDAYDAMNLAADEIVVLCTGSQGEPLSALARMASGEHRSIQIEEGDTVILSATPVPGNEKAVTKIVNALAKIGAVVYDKSKALVHVSGHAGSEELKLLLTMVKPRYFMPVHGEAVHLRAHARLAQEVGVDVDKIFVLENGESLVMRRHEVELGESVESGIVYVDGLSVGDTNQVVLRDRKLLANDGFATVAALIDPKKKRPVGEIELVLRGVSGGDESSLLDDAYCCLEDALRRALEDSYSQPHIQKVLRETLSKFIWERCRRRPMIVPLVMEI